MKSRLVLFLPLIAAAMVSSCQPQPPINADTNINRASNVSNQGSTPNANNNVNGTKTAENNDPAIADRAMIFKVDKDVSLKTKGAAEFVRILSGLFRSGDLLRVGDQSTAWVECPDDSVCPLGKGDYTACCVGTCENGIRLRPPDGTDTRALRRKTDLPPNE